MEIIIGVGVFMGAMVLAVMLERPCEGARRFWRDLW